MKRHTHIGHVARVPVSAHWTLFALGAVVLLGSVSNPAGALLGFVAYVLAFVLHELGHLLVAKHLGYHVHNVELYAFHALTRFDHPATVYDHALVAWAGVALQALVGVPILVALKTVGYTSIEPLNALLAFFSFFCITMSLLNLLPVYPLDGHLAWRLVPLLFQRARARWTGRGGKHRRGWERSGT